MGLLRTLLFLVVGYYVFKGIFKLIIYFSGGSSKRGSDDINHNKSRKSSYSGKRTSDNLGKYVDYEEVDD